MTLSPLVFFHIWTALAGVLFGMAALAIRKGSRLHRIFGNVFFVSMLTMSASAAYLAAFVKPEMMNVLMGVLTFYLVATGWLAVIRKEGVIGRLEVALMLVALADGAGGVFLGFETVTSPAGLKDGYHAVGYFVAGSLALLFAGFDVRTFVRGGVSGARRIARHLGRMCLALLIATASLFLGQQRLFPASIRGSAILFVPVVAVIVLTIYWLIRVRFGSVIATSSRLKARLSCKENPAEAGLWGPESLPD